MPTKTLEELHVEEWFRTGDAARGIARAREDIAAAHAALDTAADMIDEIEKDGGVGLRDDPALSAAAGAYLEHRRNVRYNNAVAQSTGHVLNEARITV
jgi:hypothetical protein